jgi:hypothetical protein
MPPQRRSQPNLPPQQNNEQQNREIVANIRMRLNAQELDIIALKVENEIIRKQNDSFVKTIKHLEKINKEMEETVSVFFSEIFICRILKICPPGFFCILPTELF